MIVVEK